MKELAWSRSNTVHCSTPMVLLSLFVMMGPFRVTAFAAPPYEESRVARISMFRGTREARGVLLRKGFVVAGWTKETMSDFYVVPEVPPFVTTDAAWDFFQRVQEKAFLAGEYRRALSLPLFLRKWLDRVMESEGGPAEVKAVCYTAVPLGLLGCLHEKDLRGPLGKEEREIVEKTLGKIRLSLKDKRDLEIPFLKKKVAPRFDPGSFYRSSRLLSSFWQAIQWLQCGAFDMEDPGEGKAGIILAQAVFRDPELRRAYGSYQRFLHDWMGWEDRYGLWAWSRLFREVLGDGWADLDPGRVWEGVRKWTGRKPCRLVQDFSVPTGFRKEVVLAGFSPAETPVYRFFLEDMKKTGPYRRGILSVLDLLASGPLESPAGREVSMETFGDAPWKNLLLSIEPPSPGKGIYGDGIRALRLLQVSLHPAAGPPFDSPEWRAKMAWTQLGGVAGIEHMSCLYRAMLGPPACKGEDVEGVVSPYPEFFTFLGGILRKSKILLERAGKEFPPDYKLMAEVVLQRIEDYKRYRSNRRRGKKKTSKKDFLERFNRLGEVGYIPGRVIGENGNLERAEKRASMLSVAGKSFRDSDRAWLREWFPSAAEKGLLEALDEAASILERLGALSEKQWRGGNPTKEEFTFLRRLGGKMIFILEKLSRKESLFIFPSSPPFVVEMAGVGPPSHPRRLYGGIARPEAIYILLERNGRPGLYLGGVLSFREFLLPWGAEMNDSAWSRWVDEGRCPDPPLFTKRFRRTKK